MKPGAFEVDSPLELGRAQPVGPPGRETLIQSIPAHQPTINGERVSAVQNVVTTQAELDALFGKGFARMPPVYRNVDDLIVEPGSRETEFIERVVRQLDPFQLPPEAAECERYLGVDPGLANLGLFVLGLTPTAVRCLYRETFTTSPAAGTDEQRLALIARRLHEVITTWRPKAIGYEDVRSITTGKEKAGAGNADRGPLLMICGMLIAETWYGETPCYRIANQSARVAVLGKGKTRGASKATVRDRVQELTGTRKLTLDQGDAAAMAFGAYVKHRDRNVQVRLPKKRRTKP